MHLQLSPEGALELEGPLTVEEGTPQIEGTWRTEAKTPTLFSLLSVVGTKQVLGDVGRPAEGRREQWVVGGGKTSEEASRALAWGWRWKAMSQPTAGV